MTSAGGAQPPDEPVPQPSGVTVPKQETLGPNVITNSIGRKLALMPAGEFLMGSPAGDQDAQDDEKPQHKVQISKPFCLGVTEVTQEQYERVMGQNPSNFKGDPQRPVETVSWEDAVAFCRKLSEKESRTYRLPTEALWEYACRAGTTTAWYLGDDAATLEACAWFSANAGGKMHPVGQKLPNAWGIYDMHGNVWEWCQDWLGDQYYATSPMEDPTGARGGEYRVGRSRPRPLVTNHLPRGRRFEPVGTTPVVGGLARPRSSSRRLGVVGARFRRSPRVGRRSAASPRPRLRPRPERSAKLRLRCRWFHHAGTATAVGCPAPGSSSRRWGVGASPPVFPARRAMLRCQPPAAGLANHRLRCRWFHQAGSLPATGCSG